MNDFEEAMLRLIKDIGLAFIFLCFMAGLYVIVLLILDRPIQ